MAHQFPDIADIGKYRYFSKFSQVIPVKVRYQNSQGVIYPLTLIRIMFNDFEYQKLLKKKKKKKKKKDDHQIVVSLHFDKPTQCPPPMYQLMKAEHCKPKWSKP